MCYPNIVEFTADFEGKEVLLGKGTFGSVHKYKAKKIINPDLQKLDEKDEYFAVKMMNAKSEKSFEMIQKEFLILKSLPEKHPNIITLYKVQFGLTRPTHGRIK